MALTVKKVAEISGVSVRALHFYDEIGLLKPAYLGANGYRYYEDEQLYTLQQILFFRELGLELKKIQAILKQSKFNKVKALKSHREILLRKNERTRQLIETIDKTIETLTGGRKMKAKDMFVGFDPKKQAEHEEYLIKRFGEEARDGIEKSKAKVAKWSKPQWEKTGVEWDQICKDLVGALKKKMRPESPEVQEITKRHFQWLKKFWTPNKEAYAGHGTFIVETELGKAYAGYDPELPAYIARAITHFAEHDLK